MTEKRNGTLNPGSISPQEEEEEESIGIYSSLFVRFPFYTEHPLCHCYCFSKT